MADDLAPSGSIPPHAPRPAYPHAATVANVRPSPFTMSEPTNVFSEELSSEPSPILTMTVGSLITELTAFADFYEQATAAIESAGDHVDRWYRCYRDANADVTRRNFKAARDIDRVRGYVLSRYGVQLTIGTACRLLGDLLHDPALSCADAEALTLRDAMDRLTAATEATPVAPSSATSAAATPHKDPPAPPPPAGLYADLATACEALKLRGNQRGLVDAIVTAGKPVPIADMHLALELEGTVDAGWGNTVNPINAKLKAHGLRIARVDSQATLSKTGGS